MSSLANFFIELIEKRIFTTKEAKNIESQIENRSDWKTGFTYYCLYQGRGNGFTYTPNKLRKLEAVLDRYGFDNYEHAIDAAYMP